ncbi:flavin reductase family protein [Azotosporobacter soli]|uniref:flavin reductase family protein n=1 Tax=Azotosporobacter soli TaxID=3055040 RepID=UPI0031FE8D84
MQQELSYNEYAKEAVEILSKGAFLTTAANGAQNTMTIAWGSIGYIWQRPVFMVMVRPSRHSYQMLEASGEFTVSLPLKDMKEALAVCGSKSGRELDKFAAAGLKAAPSRNVAAPIIEGCGLHYECRVVFKQTMDPAHLDPSIAAQKYASGDFHTLYFGEILACYKDA